jgi:hypothetical protein
MKKSQWKRKIWTWNVKSYAIYDYWLCVVHIKHSELSIVWLFIYSLCSYEWFLFVHNLKSDSTHHFFRNVCTKSGSLRFSVFRLLTNFVCLYAYEFWLSLCKIVRSSVILLLPLLNTTNTNLLWFSYIFQLEINPKN